MSTAPPQSPQDSGASTLLDLEASLNADLASAGFDPTSTAEETPAAPAQYQPETTPTSSDPLTQQAQPPAEPAQPAQPAAPTAPASAAQQDEFLELIRAEYGVDLSNKYRDGREALRGLLSGYERLAQRDEDAVYGRQVRQAQAAGMYQANWQQPLGPAPAADQPPAKPKREIPEYNPAWESQITRDEKGQLVAAPGAEPDVVQKLAKYHNWARTEATKMLHQPEEYFGDLIEQRAQQVIEQRLGDFAYQQDMQRSAQEAQTWMQRNMDWLCEHDPVTGQLVLDHGGHPVATPTGRVFAQHALNIAQSFPGATNEQVVALAAQLTRGAIHEQHYQAALRQAQQPAQPAPNQPAAQPAAQSPVAQPNGSRNLAAMLRGGNAPIQPAARANWEPYRDGEGLEHALLRGLNENGYQPI